MTNGVNPQIPDSIMGVIAALNQTIEELRFAYRSALKEETSFGANTRRSNIVSSINKIASRIEKLAEGYEILLHHHIAIVQEGKVSVQEVPKRFIRVDADDELQEQAKT